MNEGFGGLREYTPCGEAFSRAFLHGSTSGPAFSSHVSIESQRPIDRRHRPFRPGFGVDAMPLRITIRAFSIAWCLAMLLQLPSFGARRTTLCRTERETDSGRENRRPRQAAGNPLADDLEAMQGVWVREFANPAGVRMRVEKKVEGEADTVTEFDAQGNTCMRTRRRSNSHNTDRCEHSSFTTRWLPRARIREPDAAVVHSSIASKGIA